MKKGQITIFVILGLIALITIFITISVLTTDETDVVQREELISDDSRLVPLTQSVEACMNTLGKEALNEIGLNGGYINNPPGLNILDDYAANSNNAVKLFQSSNRMLPYWHGISSDPDCTQCEAFSLRPDLEGDEPNTIQSQVESHIEDNIIGCVNAFQDFESLDVTYDEPDAVVEFRDLETRLKLYMDLSVVVTDSQTTFDINYFENDLDIRFRNIYEIAFMITNQVIQGQNAMESMSNEIISILGGTGSNSEIPPTEGGIEMGFSGPSSWSLSNVKNTIKSTIADNINYVQIYGSRNYQRIGNIEDQFLETFINEFSYGIAANRDVLQNTKIRFNFEESYPTYLQILPSRSELIMPERVESASIPFLPITSYDYNFQYDLTYPIIVSLENNRAYDGEGYTFNFAAETNIRSNNPYDVNITEDLSRVEGIGLLDPRLNNVPITVDVYDYNGLAVEDVVVTLECVGNKIALGETEVIDGQSKIETLAPTCLNAKIYSEGPEYFSEEVYVTLDSNSEVNIELEVVKERELNVNVRKKEVLFEDEDQTLKNFEFSSGTALLENNENANIIFTRLSSSGERSNYIRVYSTDDDSNEFNLAPGRYNVLLTGMKNVPENFTTQNETISVDVPWVARAFGADAEDVEINGTDIGKELLLGMVELKEDYTLNLTPEDLDKEINFILPAVNYNKIIYTRHLELIGRATMPDDLEPFVPKIE